MKRVELPNRYGDKNYLEEVSTNKYKLILKEDNHVRFGFMEEGHYTFVDPSGGPFMSVGHQVEGIEGVLAKIEVVKGEGTFLIFKT